MLYVDFSLALCLAFWQTIYANVIVLFGFLVLYQLNQLLIQFFLALRYPHSVAIVTAGDYYFLMINIKCNFIIISQRTNSLPVELYCTFIYTD